MTELQMGLIGLGTTAVVGVLAYNKWQEYRHRKLAEAVLKPQHEDVLLGDAPKMAARSSASGEDRSEPELRAEAPTEVPQRLEPIFVDPAPSAPLADVAEAPVEPQNFEKLPVDAEPEVANATEEPSVALPAGELPAELLDPRLEFIVAMELVEPVSATQILRSQRETLTRLNKPVHWVGFNEKTREWERLAVDHDQPVRRLRVGLQLVNRMGPVSEGDLSIFTNAMQALADELMAVADMPSSRVLDQAAEVDRFCAAVDLEIGVNLVSRGAAFSGTKIRALAEAAGMVLGIDGLFTRYDDAGRAQFSLQNFESTAFSADSIRTMTTHGLTFLLDVPRVDHGERVFMQMTELAKRFGETLQGALVDDNRQPLSDAQLDHIRREYIGKPQATMASFGLPAGSPQALRLFG
nr:cell division protein FtsZ [Dechloromonas sp.]